MRWKILEKSGNKTLCRCECGTVKLVFTQNLKRGLSKSCGCLAGEVTAKRNRTHGMAGTKTYECWINMRCRCKYQSVLAYPHYGGRGISVAPEWERFEKFMEDMGTQPDGMELERINVNKGYSKKNCKWATLKQQARNKTNSRRANLNGEMLTIAEISERSGIPYMKLYKRIVSRGWAVDRAIVN